MASTRLLEAVAVTAELCGRTFSEGAARVFVADLEGHPEPAVLAALTRCRREVKGVLTVQDVVSRIDDGRPGPEAAWAMLPKDEASSVVWTDEMAAAAGVALPLICDGDMIGGRMAFKEAYVTACAAARDARRPVNWSPSLGHDPRGRESALMLAVDKGRLTMDRAQQYLPAPIANANTLALAGKIVRPMLPGKDVA
jgi:hypothetical protein